MRADLGRQMDAHRRTLDQLTTGVAIFDSTRRLVFHNTAYGQLWNLDPAFLDSAPTDPEILDRLRAEGRLPEQADFRSWKSSLMGAYQSVETLEQVWYLPGARTLRVVINPNPQGGVTYLFDDVTERFSLESSYNALMRVQGETLDSLKEGVAVFGTDGRLKLFNPAFIDLWHCDAGFLAEKPHFDFVMRACMSLHDRTQDWDDLRSLIAGLQDARTGFERRMTRTDGSIIDCMTAPLPDGATLVTFIDMTATVSVERALTERNQALLEAEKLRNDFVHHVSYELRSPLTNIIGFIQLLGEGAVGPLNAKQREYTGYVLKSSAALLAIINDILDLASIDTDAMELSLEHVDIRETIAAAALRIAFGEQLHGSDHDPIINSINAAARGYQTAPVAPRGNGDKPFRPQDRESVRLWLDIGRKRPVPHESWYQVAGYFFYYGHYYAGLCIEHAPADQQETLRHQLSHVMLSLQEKDGSWWDYPLYNYHQQYGTAFALMTLKRCK
jgi:PAS domain-containing protein